MRVKRGFTLIELLVVVGIISLLIAITMPSLAAARRQSRATACKHNLKQIGLALQTYLHTTKDILPHCARLPLEDAELPKLSETLETETGKAEELWKCPSDRGPLDPSSLPEINGTYFGTIETSYEWNDNVNGQRIRSRNVIMEFGGEESGIPPVEMKFRPEETPLVNDFEGWHAKEPDKPHATNMLYADWHIDDL